MNKPIVKISKHLWLHFAAGVVPVTITVAVGEPLIVTCVIPGHLSGVYNSSQLAFEFEKGGHQYTFDNEWIDRANGTAAVLKYPHVSADWDNARVGCYIVDHPVICGSRPVRVYRKCPCY